jgi:adenylyltransferase/sulfurtransferase
MNFITPAELKAMMDSGENFQLIDTRVEEKYDRCHLAGALSIPQLDLPYKLDLINSNIRTVIYCLYGIKSEQVYIYLKDKLRIKELYILDGGIYKYATELDPSMDV